MSRFGGYKRYLLWVLVVILAFNFLDRAALGLVLENIKSDLHLSDTQLGLITGVAFALFYSVMGLPIARCADQGDRVVVISLTIAMWSLMVALCGMAWSFLSLLLLRMGVGVGEAGCIPPAHSLIADYFTRAERPRAAAIYALGGPLSFLVGYFVAGWLSELYGWRSMFVMLGAPGALLAALAWFSLEEPRRKSRSKKQQVVSDAALRARRSSAADESFVKVCHWLWCNKTFRRLLVANSVIYFFGYGILQWQPTFFIRSHGFTAGELGSRLAIIYGVVGLAGTYLGGAVASRYAARREALQLRGLAVVICLHGLLLIGVYACTQRYTALALLAAANLAGYAVYGPLFSTLQTLVPARMRAVSIALVYLFANLIGLGLGPLLTGALSDALHSWAGEESLRYSLLLLAPGFFLAGWQLWQGSNSVAGDIAASADCQGDETDHEGARLCC